MSAWIVLFSTLAYLGLLFAIAYLSERSGKKGKSWVKNPYVYALSMAIYCTAWTFYGSVGRAATGGGQFLGVFLGPTLMAPLWMKVLKKIIVISQSQRINSIADFISARYGKGAFLGGLVTLIAIFSIIPYIALQLKAISFSFDLVTQHDPSLGAVLGGEVFYKDTAFYTALILGLFTILFGTRHLEASERHEGLVAAVVFESIIKLLAFLAAGLFVVFWVFKGPGDLMAAANEFPRVQEVLGLTAESTMNPWSWLWLLLISMMAILLLPRQFHISVVENTDPRHVDRAIWLFPLYLFLINLFVVPIAAGGLIKFSGMDVAPDSFVLSLPLSEGQNLLAMVIFIGGLSASTSMVIVATIALSIMASNSIVVPLLLRSPLAPENYVHDLSGRLRSIRRLVILVILLLAYVYFASLGQDEPLVSIGLVSFTAVAQFAPALLGGIYWKEGNRLGATVGLIAGFLVWAYTLPFPSLIQAGHFPMEILTDGPWGISILRPYALLGLEGFDQISHSAFWSLFLNAGLYFTLSVYTRQSSIEEVQANLFVNIYRLNQSQQGKLWRGKAYLKDLKLLLNRFLGVNRTQELLAAYSRRNKVQLENTKEASSDLVNYSERLLAGAIGSASSRLLISSIVKEEPLTRQDMMEVLDETQHLVQYSRELEKKSRELERASKKLKAANDRLREMDRLKDDFIATVTHELRTPITSIRALSNILHDTQDIAPAKRQEFLGIIIKETERISRLINQVLDLEKMESGHAEWNIVELDFNDLVSRAVKGMKQLCVQKGIMLEEAYPNHKSLIKGDWDRLTQVVVNLMSNAIKFCPEKNGQVHVQVHMESDRVQLSVRDNGPGIDPQVQPYIFDKFTQFNDYKGKLQQGSGLGLSITWRIVRIHQGTIDLESELGAGTTFIVTLPKGGATLEQMQRPSYQRANARDLS